jgi:hypothetical protein
MEDTMDRLCNMQPRGSASRQWLETAPPPVIRVKKRTLPAQKLETIAEESCCFEDLEQSGYESIEPDSPSQTRASALRFGQSGYEIIEPDSPSQTRASALRFGQSGYESFEPDFPSQIRASALRSG